MKRLLTVLLVLPILFGSVCQAQEGPAADDSKPASSNVPGQQFPRIDTQLRATFRIKAPNAQKVQVSIGKTHDMTRSDDGVRTATTNPLVPGFHYYWLVIDGVTIADPASESFFGVGKMSSDIEVPEAGVDFHDARDAPDGEVRAKPNGIMADADAFNRKVHLLWLGVGAAEQKRMLDSVRNYHDALERAGVKTVFYESPGTAHEWQTWRRCVKEFATLLFQSAPAAHAADDSPRRGPAALRRPIVLGPDDKFPTVCQISYGFIRSKWCR